MKKSVFNFTINVIMTICMSAIIGIGFLIKYTLISGQDRWIKYGNNTKLSFLEMDRHEWGTIHLILAFTLMLLLIVHIYFHWKIICSVYFKLIENTISKKILVLCFIIICLFLILSPFFIKPKAETIQKGKGRQVAYITNSYTNF